METGPTERVDQGNRAKPTPGEPTAVVPGKRIEGEPVAASIRESVDTRVDRLERHGVTPTLGTVLVSDDPADGRFIELKHAACDAVGIATRDVRLAPSGTRASVERLVEQLCGDPDVHGVFVQAPLPVGTDALAVRGRLDREKDVDCFHPENLGRLVGGEPRFVPATPAAVLHLLEAYDVPTDGQDTVVVGRSSVIGRPLANLLLSDDTSGNATVTVCHTRTRALGDKTRAADVVITAAGEPGLVDGSMLAPGVTVIDVSSNRRPTEDGYQVVGDVEYASAAQVADAITPVPGGVGPVTIAMLLRNVVLAAERQTGHRTASGSPDT